MDFLSKATDKLNIGGGGGDSGGKKVGGKGRGQGGHLGASNDGGGFPDGIRPADWMGDLISKNHISPSSAVTDFRYPGSHDCATYKSGLASFSYQCQEKNLYEQMKVGQRMFDLRLAQVEGGKKFIPVHGIAKNTGDDFNQTPDKADTDDLTTQIVKFAKEHPKELLVFQVLVTDINKPEIKKDFLDGKYPPPSFHLLGPHLLESPQKGEKPSTYDQAISSHRNVIWGIAGCGKTDNHQIDKYIWDVGKSTPCWLGQGNGKLWNEPTWQSGDLKKVLASTEQFMKEEEQHLRPRDRFWVAQCQLTPALGQGISTFISDGGSVRPKDLALGGGIGSHGSFQGSNKELRDSGKLESGLWKELVSCIIYDFCDMHTTGEIVKMNIGGAGGRAGGRGGREEVDEEREKPARHGGGEGGHLSNKLRDEEEGGGRGGHGGRGGRGGRHRDD